MIEEYSLGWSQDQHFLHRRFKPSRLRQALEYGFPDDETTGALSMLFYGGDFYDHLADSVHDEDFQDSCAYISWRCQSAARWGYPIRVLLGTKSHDMDQGHWWTKINDSLRKPADLKYVDRVSIEHHPVLGDILYVPDNWKPTADEVWEDVCELLRSKNMTMVDWIIMHGAFKHQLPEHLHNKVHFLHDSQRYSSICRKYVLVGHVHLQSQWKNIISCGSLDRQAFGEEAPKGMLKIKVKPTADEILFIENPYARVMLTYPVQDDAPDIEDVVHWIDDQIIKYTDEYMSLRFICPKSSELYLNQKALMQKYPNVELVFKDNEDKAKNTHLIKLNQTKTLQTEYDLSNDSVVKMLNQRIGDKLTPSISDKIKSIFS